MLFDLRASGRRRTIKVIYVFLALLLGGGLIFFGIGGATNGGLLDAFKGGSSTSAEKVAQKKIDSAVKVVHLRPQDPEAWRALTKAQYQMAGLGQTTDASGNSTYTSKGILHLRQAAGSWDHYVSLEKGQVDPTLATLMTQAFLPVGLNKPDEALKAWQIVVDSRPPSTGLYAQLAQLAYAASNIRLGDLAAQKAVSLAPKNERKSVKDQLNALKTQVQGSGSQGGGSGTLTTPSGTGTTG